MTLSELLAQAKKDTNPDHDPTFTLKEVAIITNTPYKTVLGWVFTQKVLPIVRIGPTQRAHVRRSVILRMWCPHVVVRRS